jgi:hypothetical protein
MSRKETNKHDISGIKNDFYHEYNYKQAAVCTFISVIIFVSLVFIRYYFDK